MLTKSKTFNGVRFSVKTYQDAFEVFDRIVNDEYQEHTFQTHPVSAEFPLPWANASEVPISQPNSFQNMSTKTGVTQWTFDKSSEFLAEMRTNYDSASFRFQPGNFARYSTRIVQVMVYQTYVTVATTMETRGDVEEVMGVFEEAVEKSRLPAPPPPVVAPPERPQIFIGHGGKSKDWLSLQNELQNVHGYRVESFEAGERAGHSIRDILSGFLENNAFAILIFSGEDEQADGSIRARENVVHEAGLFQGKLGFSRAIIVEEKGTGVPSNLDGVQYVEYETGNIQGAVGRILAVLKREFPEFH